MSIQYDDTLLDFDLDFLHQTANTSVAPEKTAEKPDRSRKSLSLVKKKIIATDSLIRKYYEKKEEVEQIDKTLSLSKEEYKQTCIAFQNIVEKFNIKEQEAQTLRNSNVELQEKYEHAHNTVAAMQSHTNQLQNLVKQNETTIESLTIENQLHKSNAKNYEKKFGTLQKQNEELMKHICLVRDVVFGKKKLNKRRKEILLKYNKHYESEDNDSLFGDQSSGPDTDTENDLTPLTCSKVGTLVKGRSGKDKVKGEALSFNDNGHESDCSNELASADTGRGSSLAFSDGEKCFNSPDYFTTHSPVNPDTVIHTKKLVTTATSPIQFTKNVQVATSPPAFEYDNIQITFSPISSHDKDENKDMAVTPTHCDDSDIESDKAQYEMPSNSTTEVNSLITPVISDPHSDICIDEETTSSSPVIIPGSDQSSDSSLNNSETLGEKECLELNNSNNLENNSIGDCEIEMILHRMRLHHTLLTPIPNSPSKSSRCSTNAKASQEVDDNVCKDVEKIREENKILNKKLTDLAQEIVNIKCILRDKRFLDTDRQVSDIFNTSPNNTELHPHMKNTQNTVSSCVSPSVKINEETLGNIQVIQPQTPSTKKLNRIDFNKKSATVSQKKSEHVKSSNKNITGHPSDSMTKDKNRTRAKLNDKLEFEDMLPLSPVKRTKDPKNFNSSSGFTQGSEVKSSRFINIAEDIDEDSLPLSTMLGCGREPIHDENTRKEIVTPEATSSFDKQNTTDQLLSKNASKHRKLTKLEKMRNKLLPKSKIKNISNLPIKKLRPRPKKLPSLPKQISANANAASLNDKEVYQKALKIMSELKAKEQCKKIESPFKNKLRSKGVDLDSIGNKDSAEKELPSFNSPCIDKRTIKDDSQIPVKNISRKEKETLSEADEYDSLFSKTEANREDVQSTIINNHYKGEVTHNDQCEKGLVVDSNKNCSLSPKKVITTRSRTKCVEELNTSPCKNSVTDLSTSPCKNSVTELNTSPSKNSVTEIEISNKLNEKSKEIDNEAVLRQGSRKRPKRASIDQPDIQCKRMLRSSTLRQSKSEENSSPCSNNVSSPVIVSNVSNQEIDAGGDSITTMLDDAPKNIISYNDIEMFTGDKDILTHQNNEEKQQRVTPKDNIFCVMVDKFGKQSTKNFTKKLPDSVIASTSKLLQEEIARISELSPNDTKVAMNKLVDIILNWGCKQFIAGFMAYLKDPQRKIELYNKISSPPAPPMTKAEQIMLYIILQLRGCWSSVDVVDCILCNIEYMLFKLNRTPEFGTIESTSHFYAVLCRYFKMKSRLRLFMLDAMYCIQFKAVPLIKQCLEVWMHVLPLAHMGIAKTPLVTCMVYLLHFYKCDDRFNRVQDIRNILNRKYFYEITDWNEPKIIEMFKNAINDVRAIPMEKKLLRIALIVIAKRHGPRWCQNNIIKKLLLPMIESDAPDRVKIFCVSLLGPLLKPYPVDMKVHCEIVMNQLLDILKQNPSLLMEEAIFTSLIYMSKHNYTRVIQSLIAWKPQRVSPELERLLRDFVREKPLKAWKTVLSKIQIV